MHHTSCQRDLEVVKCLMEEAGANPRIRGGCNKITPLHYASRYGHLETVKYLLEECKVNTDVGDIHGETPLHCDSSKGHIETVKYFVEYGADISMKSISSYTFLDLLKGEQKDEIEKMIEDLKWRKSNVKSRRF